MSCNSKYGVVRVATAPLRGEGKRTSTLVDEVLMGMPLEIVGEYENGYYYVKTDYDYEGYIAEEDMIIRTNYPNEWIDSALHRLDIVYCDVMKEGKFQSYSIGNMVGGSIVNCTGVSNENWCEVQLPDGKIGWIRKEFITKKINKPIDDKEKLRENIVNTAKKYLGTQYRWGGKSNIGIDCSGLCSMAYRINGLSIFRDAIFKDEELVEISFQNMKKGDLIFYKGHIAMYIGEGKIIHSTGFKAGVVIESLIDGDDDYRPWLVEAITKIGTHKNLL